MTTTEPPTEYLAAPNKTVGAENGIDYAYREIGEGTPALVLLHHFRANLDNWDPALVDALALDRRVVTFDNAGVAGSTGTTPSTIAQMARDAIAFLEALQLGGLIPRARVKIYPDAAHGFLFQHHDEFARDIDALSATDQLGLGARQRA